jgi:hypothetical protein
MDAPTAQGDLSMRSSRRVLIALSLPALAALGGCASSADSGGVAGMPPVQSVGLYGASDGVGSALVSTRQVAEARRTAPGPSTASAPIDR